MICKAKYPLPPFLPPSATPPDPRIFVPAGTFNLIFPPNESVTRGTSIDLNRCVSVLLGKLDANNQGHKKRQWLQVCSNLWGHADKDSSGTPNRKTLGYTPVPRD